MKILYQDKYVSITQYSLTIRKYYFPLATSKTVMFSDMKKISLENALNVNHLWGTSTHYLNNWFNYDSERSHKDKFIQIEVKNSRIRPSFTCEDCTKAFQILRNHFMEMDRKSVMFNSNRNKDTQLAHEQAHEMMKQQQEFQSNQNKKKQKQIAKQEGEENQINEQNQNTMTQLQPVEKKKVQPQGQNESQA